MNDLRLLTKKTSDPRVFDTYWMTGLIQKGRVRVTVPAQKDAQTAAELSAAQYLLSEKNVCGHNKAGAGLRIWVSRGAIRKLLRGISDNDRMSPYANFLLTRYLGAQVEVENQDTSWADERCETQVDIMDVQGPAMTTIEVNGFGLVELTGHAVARYIEHFKRQPERAWREIVEIAKEVKPAIIKGRKSIHDLQHRNKGRYAMDAKRGVLLTIADPDKPGMLPSLVTIMIPDDRAAYAECNKTDSQC